MGHVEGDDGVGGCLCVVDGVALDGALVDFFGGGLALALRVGLRFFAMEFLGASGDAVDFG